MSLRSATGPDGPMTKSPSCSRGRRIQGKTVYGSTSGRPQSMTKSAAGHGMLHGGGFAAVWQELRSYDGENLCKTRRRSVVSLNHRLNVFGFSICPSTAIDTRAPRTSACSTSLRAGNAQRQHRPIRAIPQGHHFRAIGSGCQSGHTHGDARRPGPFSPCHRGKRLDAPGRTAEMSQEVAAQVIAELGLNASSIDKCRRSHQALLQASGSRHR